MAGKRKRGVAAGTQQRIKVSDPTHDETPHQISLRRGTKQIRKQSVRTTGYYPGSLITSQLQQAPPASTAT